MMIRQLYDPLSSTYTYLLACPKTRQAVIIDPVFEQFNRDAALVRELGLDLKFVLDTHVHADHVTSAWLMKEALGARIVLSASYEIDDVDYPVADGDQVNFGEETLVVMTTPGHTHGCVSYVTADRRRVFTGDSLMIRGAGRTDFQSGDAAGLWQSITGKLFSLPDDCVIYPGHDYQGRISSTIDEERRFNPRLGGDARQEDFVGFMNNLGLPHPKLLDIAVPANLDLGRPTDSQLPQVQAWAPTVENFAGVVEVEPDWVASHLDTVTILDVRSPQEYDGELGHLSPSLLIPLDVLRQRIDEVPRERPVVAVCQSGKRSALAVQILKAAGITRVANLPGGMVHWNQMALPKSG